MIERTCLIIDDENQEGIFEKIQRLGEKHNLKIECLQLNVGNQEYREFLDNEEISLQKVSEVFQERYKGKSIHVMAFDWNLGSNIKGPHIIKHFNDNKIRENIPKLLYSGALKEEVEKIFSLYKDGQFTFKKAWDEIQPLMATHATIFKERDTYENGIIELLKKVDDTFDSTIEEELRKFPDLVFKPGFTNKSFNGKTYQEIANLLNDKQLKNEFNKEIIQQVMAYLTEKI